MPLLQDTISQPARARVQREDTQQVLVVPMLDLHTPEPPATAPAPAPARQGLWGLLERVVRRFSPPVAARDPAPAPAMAPLAPLLERFRAFMWGRKSPELECAV